MIAGRCVERFWSKVDRWGDESCWLWKASTSGNGYGKFGLSGRGSGWAYAHRVAWLLLRGDIPAELEIDHLCRQRSCVNPNHLELVTHAENMKRQARAVSLLCAKQHVFDGLRDSRGRRVCRACRRQRDRKRRGRSDAGQWYATLPASQLVHLLRAAGYGTPHDDRAT